MPSPYITVGAASRLADLPERIRERRLENENRELALSDRARRINREDESTSRERTRFDREQEEWRLEDTDRMQRDAEHIEDRARQRKINLRTDNEHEQDRSYTTESRGLSLAESKKQSRRGDVLWARNQEEVAKKMHEEGMHDMLTALERGADPAMVERQFNAKGELKFQPGTLRYDGATGQISFVDSDGESFDGPINELKAIFVPPAAPVKLGEKDRLVDPVTHKEIVGPSKGALGAGGTGNAKWNRQTASDKAADVVREGLGLKFDSELKSWSIPEGMSEKVSYGASLAGQITREFGERISAEEAGDIALQVAKTVPTLQEAQTQAQQLLSASGVPASGADLSQKAEQIMRAARVRAAQRLTQLMQDKEYELEQREQEAAGGGEGQQRPAGERPPLSQFQR